jgi:hypothetical protein
MNWRRGMTLTLILSALFASRTVSASEIWTFRFNALNNRLSTSFQDDLIFYNTTGQDAVVRLLGVSNGEIRPDDRLEISVPAGRTESMWTHFDTWIPDTFPGFWAVHVEVPDGVLVASRGGAMSQCPPPCAAPTNPFPNLGVFPMPVFGSLVPAGTRQVHMGADLGTKAARFNAGLYNSSSLPAVATISVYQACDDALLETRIVPVPANTALQVSGLGAVKPTCAFADPRPHNSWLRYAIVVVDQPSVSYVMNVAEDLPYFPSIPFATAIGF